MGREKGDGGKGKEKYSNGDKGEDEGK